MKYIIILVLIIVIFYVINITSSKKWVKAATDYLNTTSIPEFTGSIASSLALKHVTISEDREIIDARTIALCFIYTIPDIIAMPTSTSPGEREANNIRSALAKNTDLYNLFYEKYSTAVQSLDKNTMDTKPLESKEFRKLIKDAILEIHASNADKI